jgi:hypothetical protein
MSLFAFVNAEPMSTNATIFRFASPRALCVMEMNTVRWVMMNLSAKLVLMALVTVKLPKSVFRFGMFAMELLIVRISLMSWVVTVEVVRAIKLRCARAKRLLCAF